MGSRFISLSTNERALMDFDGDIVYYDKEDHYIADDRENDLEYLKETYGYDIAAMHVDKPSESYLSIYDDDDDIVSSVAESAVLCNGPPDPPDWLGYCVDQGNDYDIHNEPLAFDQAIIMKLKSGLEWLLEAPQRIAQKLFTMKVHLKFQVWMLGEIYTVLLKLQLENKRMLLPNIYARYGASTKRRLIEQSTVLYN